MELFFGVQREVGQLHFDRLLRASYDKHPLHTLKLMAHIRDCRNGKGERALGRWALQWLAKHHKRELVHNLKPLIAQYGRFDDTMALMDTPAEKDALELLRLQLIEGLAALRSDDNTVVNKRPITLCAKWIPSEKKALNTQLKMNKKLSKHMKLKAAQLRKQYLVPLRAKLEPLE